MDDSTLATFTTIVVLSLDVLDSLVERWVLGEYPGSSIVDEDDCRINLFVIETQ